MPRPHVPSSYTATFGPRGTSLSATSASTTCTNSPGRACWGTRATSRQTARSASARLHRRLAGVRRHCGDALSTSMPSRRSGSTISPPTSGPTGGCRRSLPNPAGDGPSGIAFEDMSAGSAGWGDAAVLVPWELWRHYGDLDALRERLPSMRKWVEYAAGAAAAGSRHGIALRHCPRRLRTRSPCGTAGSTSASGSSPGSRRGRIRPRTTASSRRRSCTARRGSSRRALRSPAPTSSEEWADGVANGARDAWRTEFVTAPGRLSMRLSRRTMRVGSRSSCSTRTKPRSRPLGSRS